MYHGLRWIGITLGGLMMPPAANAAAEPGRYLAMTLCAACHGTDLRGVANPTYVSPNLQVVAAYSAEQFARLLRMGVPLGGQTLTTMGPYARGHLALLSDAEIASLHAYLHTLPDAAG